MSSIRPVGSPATLDPTSQTSASAPVASSPAPGDGAGRGWVQGQPQPKQVGKASAGAPSAEVIAQTKVAALLQRPKDLVTMLLKHPQDQVLWHTALGAVRAQPDLTPYVAESLRAPEAAPLRLALAEERSARLLATAPPLTSSTRLPPGEPPAVGAAVAQGLGRALGPGNPAALRDFEGAHAGDVALLEGAAKALQSGPAALAVRGLTPPGGRAELAVGTDGQGGPSGLLLRTTDAKGKTQLYALAAEVPRAQLDAALEASPRFKAAWVAAAQQLTPGGAAEVRRPLFASEQALRATLDALPEGERAALFTAMDPKAPLGGLARPVTGVRPFAAVEVTGGVASSVTTDLGAVPGLGRLEAQVKADPSTVLAPTFLKYAERGSQPEQVTGVDVDNLVGMAMSLPMKQQLADPTYVPKADESFFGPKEQAVAAKVGDQIRAITAERGPGQPALVSLVPVVVTTPDERVTEVPLFKVAGAKGNEYVDTTGRRYADLADFKANNQLPPGLMTLPKDGEARLGADLRVPTETLNTPATQDSWGKTLRHALDTAAVVGGVLVGGAMVLGTGGTALLAAGAVLGAYGAVTSGASLVDRARHGQTLNPLDAEARQGWYGVAGSALMLTGLGAAKVLTEARTAASVASAAFVGANTVDAAATVEGAAFATEHWKDLSPRDRLAMAANVALFGVGVRASGGLRSSFDFRTLRAQMLE